MLFTATVMWVAMLFWIAVLVVLHKSGRGLPGLPFRNLARGTGALVVAFALYHVASAAMGALLPSWFYIWVYVGIFSPLIIGMVVASELSRR